MQYLCVIKEICYYIEKNMTDLLRVVLNISKEYKDVHTTLMK